ncbi:uncharacterized protein LOC144751118 [Ciona intestinalis]
MRLLIEANNIVIKRLSALDSTAVCASVAQYFSPRKNIAMAINAPLHETIEVDQYRARVGLCQGLSLGAFETTSGRMIAFYINRIETGGKTNGSAVTSDTDYFKEKYEWVGPISRLSEHAKENIFRDTGVEKPFEIDFGAVDPKYSKHGISTTLSIMSEDVAKENGCDSIASFVTSSYTLGSLKKLGYSIASRFDLSYYVDRKTGLRPFVNATPPHNIVGSLYKLL